MNTFFQRSLNESVANSDVKIYTLQMNRLHLNNVISDMKQKKKS